MSIGPVIIPITVPIAGVIRVIVIIVTVITTPSPRIAKRQCQTIIPTTIVIIIPVVSITPRRITAPITCWIISIVIVKSNTRVTVRRVIDIAIINTPTIWVIIVGIIIVVVITITIGIIVIFVVDIVITIV
jgi:hypothetical protein